MLTLESDWKKDSVKPKGVSIFMPETLKINNQEISFINLNKSNFDKRDYKVENFINKQNFSSKELKNIEDIVKQDSYVTSRKAPIYNQGSTNMCGGFTMSSVMATMNYIERGEYERYSAGFIFAMREKNDWQGDGVNLREILKMAKQYGTCPESDFPIYGDYNKVKPVLQEHLDYLLPKAKENAIKSFYMLNKDDIEGIKRSIVVNGVVVIAWGIYQSIANVGKDGIVTDIKNGEKYYGGHMSYVVGWKTINGKLYWILANSWGKDVGSNGYYYIPHNYKAIFELAGVTDKEFVPNNISVSLREGDNTLYIKKGEEWEKVKLDVAPEIKIVDENGGGRLLVPLRGIFEVFGFDVNWDDKTKMATISNYDFDKEDLTN